MAKDMFVVDEEERAGLTDLRGGRRASVGGHDISGHGPIIAVPKVTVKADLIILAFVRVHHDVLTNVDRDGGERQRDVKGFERTR